MPNAAKKFTIAKGTKSPTVQCHKPKPRSSSKAGYDAAWQRYRAYFAGIVVPVCGNRLGGVATEYACGKSFPSRQMHLDHAIPFASLDDPLRFSDENMVWRCLWCHTEKTNAKDGGGWQKGNDRAIS